MQFGPDMFSDHFPFDATSFRKKVDQNFVVSIATTISKHMVKIVGGKIPLTFQLSQFWKETECV